MGSSFTGGADRYTPLPDRWAAMCSLRGAVRVRCVSSGQNLARLFARLFTVLGSRRCGIACYRSCHLERAPDRVAACGYAVASPPSSLIYPNENSARSSVPKLRIRFLDPDVDLQRNEARLKAEKLFAGAGTNSNDLTDRRRVARVKRVRWGRKLLAEVAIILRILVE